MGKSTIKPEDRERFTRELMRVLDSIEETEEARKIAAADFRQELAKLHERARHWRALLAGRKGEQLELPAEAET
ncbi:MAG: hypothetical protein ACOZIN_08480 [Myxococcota bacterium]